MKRFIPKLLLLGSLACCTRLHAQETTATLSGLILDGKGVPVASATISVKHEPTGYALATQANNKGIFTLPNLRPGGPYTIIITSTGFKADTLNDVNLTLGNNPAGNITLEQQGQMLTEVVVTSGGRRSGLAGTTVGRAQLTTMPTLGRSLSDFTRLTPQSNNNSFAGTNFRYNNLTVDGAINNDAIGFSNSFGGVSGGGQSGAAGAGTRTNPYSLDVIQEVQVQLAPYDVKLGNFTGGSVNAVTKSGSNDFHGSVYGYGRNQTLMGKSVDGQKTKIGSDFHDYQFGATIGGPIIKNKLFFIANYEQTRRQEPTFYNAGDPGAAVSVADAKAIYDQLQSKGYDAGAYMGAYKIFTNSDKFFGRIDYNIDANNTLTVRGIYTKGTGNNLERTSTNFQFGSTDFTQTTKNYNLTAELKSRISNNVSNQFNVSYINVHEYRDFPGTLSPLMDIGGGAVWVGTWREASIYNMKQQTFELTDNVTYTKGINKFTFGTHNEFYNLTYGFVNSWNGRWEYSNLNSFLADQPSRIRGAYTIDPIQHPNTRESLYNNPPNPYKVALMSAYAQDEVTLSRTFKITPGLRVDYPKLGNNIPVDADFAKATSNTLNATYNSTSFNAFTNKWLGTATLSPRIGFNWDVNGNQKLIVRGGAGVFVGRMPFAWLGYAETLNGGVYNNIDFKPTTSNTKNKDITIPVALDPQTLKNTIINHALDTVGAAYTREVDVIDNKFKLPRVIRTNIAADYKFGNGYKLTVDVLYTKTLYDVKFQQINIKDQVEYYNQGPTESPVYTGGKLNSQYSNVYLLTNTKEGYRYNLTAQLSKTYSPISLGHGALNVNWSAAYTYGVSKDLSNGIRNSFQSNFEVNPAIVANNPQLAYSNFDLRHRIVATLGSSWMWNAKNTTSLTFFYSGQSGSPYSVVYNSSGNPFGNAANANLPYIPKDQSDIRLVDKGTYTAAQQWQDLNNLIENDKYLKTRRGQYAERNGLRTPWNHELDLKLMHTFNLSSTNKQHTLAVSLDVFNVLNLLNSDWGHITFVTNVNNYTVNMLNFVGYSTDANGNPIAGSGQKVDKPSNGYIPTFTFNKPTGLGGHYYTVDPINSRWQGQLGIKYSF